MHELSSLLAASPALFAGVVFLFGLLIGSFLNVVIHRLPIMMEREWRQNCAETMGQEPAAEDTEPYTLSKPRSACPKCGHQIRAHENIPVISWLFLRGRCSGCGNPISIRYPLVELLTGLLSATVAYHFGFGWEAAAGLLLTWALIALAGIDCDTQLLPDSITLPLLWVGLLLSLFAADVDALALFRTPEESIVGAVAGYMSLWSVYQLFRLLTGKEGMGFGDFKLLAALGAWLGWQALPLIVLLSAVVGAVVGVGLIVLARHGRNVPIPFGPYLAAAGWIAMLWGEQISGAYLRAAGL